MAVTIIERPQGQVLSTTGVTGIISSTYGTGDATVGSAAHGLSDGDYIYLISDIEDYNGFWYVDVTGIDTFELLPYLGGDAVQYIQDATVTYYVSTLSHGWSAVHLPITYRLSNDLYPTLSGSPTGILSVTDANGYSVINLAGSLGTGINSYDFIRITAPNDTELSKVYQILEFISPTVMIINLEYDSGNDFTSATAKKEYNNYNIIVRVYAGIASGHEWTSQKPMELAATLELIPDENNEVFFSINEILKSYIETRNNLLLGTLPNNIDFWNNFYIETAESYDDSDGYAFGTYTSNYTSDAANFTGYSVNAKLEFKNLYSGYMSEYLMNNSTAKFLTLFAIPVLFGCTDDVPDCYNEVTFIKRSSIDYTLNKQYYSNGNAGLLEQETITGDEGVYRVPIEPNCAYDRVDLELVFDSDTVPTTDGATFASVVNGGTQDWSSAQPFIVMVIGGAGTFTSYTRYIEFNAIAGTEVTGLMEWQHTTPTGSITGSTLRIVLLDENFTVVGNQDIDTGTGTSGTSTLLSITPTGDVYYVGFLVVVTSSFSATSRTFIDAFNVTSEEVTISETKQFKIDCECSPQELRLTWLNNLGGFDYWKFTANKDLIVEITETGETKKNILPQWPKSYGTNSDTIRRQTFRVSNKAYIVRSQFLTQDEVDALAYIKSSVLVQIINSRQDRRTVIVDSDSFVIRVEQDKTYTIAFNVSFTNDIPSQTV